jgi:hypothetical protein
MAKRTAWPYPGLAWPDAARHYIGTVSFHVGPCRTAGSNCQPRPVPKALLVVSGQPEARKSPTRRAVAPHRCVAAAAGGARVGRGEVGIAVQRLALL